MNLLGPFLERVAQHPDRPALIAKGKSLSFAELDRRSRALAVKYQAQGLGEGDVVLVLHSVSIPLYVILLALFRMGAVAMFPDPASGIRGLASCLAEVAVRGFCGHWKARVIRWFITPLRRIPLSLPSSTHDLRDGTSCGDLPPDAPALITFTSGSTGRAKGIVRSHGFLLRQHEAVERTLGPCDGDRDLISLPVFVLSNLASGVTSVIPEGDLRRPGKIDPAPILEQIERYEVNRLVVPPAFCEQLASTGARLPRIEKVFTGGGPVFPDLLRRMAELAPDAEITVVYGSTEAEPIAHIALSEISESDFRSMQKGAGLLAGRLAADVRVRILDDEIVVTGQHVVKGYINQSDDVSTKVVMDGEIWHQTGDAGRLDDRGRLWLLGRHEARVGSIYPFCVETAARTFPGVRQAAFLAQDGTRILAVEASGDVNWDELTAAMAKPFGDVSVRPVARIPLDKRHNSKVDYGRLRAILAKPEIPIRIFCPSQKS